VKPDASAMYLRLRQQSEATTLVRGGTRSNGQLLEVQALQPRHCRANHDLPRRRRSHTRCRRSRRLLRTLYPFPNGFSDLRRGRADLGLALRQPASLTF
jgi:hypothetical protein